MSAFTRRWVPNQHGAWAFLITPVVVGALAGGPSPWHAILLAAWLAAYCLNFFTTLALKSRKPGRYVRQLTAYGVATGLGGGVSALHEPQLLRIALAALPAFAIHLWHVRQRNERAWLNDLVGIALAGVVGYGAYLAGSAPHDDAASRHVAIALLAVCLYFAGTVVYVKTMIRERGSVVWRRVSYGYHAALVALAAVGGAWPLAVIAVALLARAIAVPKRAWTPKRVGLTEVVFTIAVGVAALVTRP